MWYHWLLFVIALVLLGFGLYGLVSPGFPKTWLSRLWQFGLLGLYTYVAYWAYSKATAPPPMLSFGGGKRRY